MNAKIVSTRSIVMAVVALTVIVAALVPASPVYADSEKYLEMIRQDLRTTKMAYMTEGMNLTAEQGELFWPIYRDYLNKLSEIGDRRIVNIKEFAENFENMTGDKASEIMKNSFKNKKDYYSLLEKTAKKVGKELDPVMAGRFVQMENTLNLLIDLQLESEIPLFEEPLEAPAEAPAEAPVEE